MAKQKKMMCTAFIKNSDSLLNETHSLSEQKIKNVLFNAAESRRWFSMGEVPNICYAVLEPVCLEPFGNEHEQ